MAAPRPAPGTTPATPPPATTIGTGNRLKDDTNWNYYYDAAGNLIKKTKLGDTETWSYGYDVGNRLVKVRSRSPTAAFC